MNEDNESIFSAHEAATYSLNFHRRHMNVMTKLLPNSEFEYFMHKKMRQI